MGACMGLWLPMSHRMLCVCGCALVSEAVYNTLCVCSSEMGNVQFRPTAPDVVFTSIYCALTVLCLCEFVGFMIKVRKSEAGRSHKDEKARRMLNYRALVASVNTVGVLLTLLLRLGSRLTRKHLPAFANVCVCV